MLLISGQITRVIIVALTIFWSCWAPFVGAISAAHDPLLRKQAELARHAEFDQRGQTAFNHRHNDGSIEEQRPNHNHGHGSSDHTHEFPELISTFPAMLVIGPQSWLRHDSLAVYSTPSLPPERPPKLSTLA